MLSTLFVSVALILCNVLSAVSLRITYPDSSVSTVPIDQTLQVRWTYVPANDPTRLNLTVLYTDTAQHSAATNGRYLFPGLASIDGNFNITWAALNFFYPGLQCRIGIYFIDGISFVSESPPFLLVHGNETSSTTPAPSQTSHSESIISTYTGTIRQTIGTATVSTPPLTPAPSTTEISSTPDSMPLPSYLQSMISEFVQTQTLVDTSMSPQTPHSDSSSPNTTTSLPISGIGTDIRASTDIHTHNTTDSASAEISATPAGQQSTRESHSSSPSPLGEKIRGELSMRLVLMLATFGSVLTLF